MEFRTLTDKKSKELNIDSDTIEASNQVEVFEKEETENKSMKKSFKIWFVNINNLNKKWITRVAN